MNTLTLTTKELDYLANNLRCRLIEMENYLNIPNLKEEDKQRTLYKLSMCESVIDKICQLPH